MSIGGPSVRVGDVNVEQHVLLVNGDIFVDLGPRGAAAARHAIELEGEVVGALERAAGAGLDQVAVEADLAGHGHGAQRRREDRDSRGRRENQRDDGDDEDGEWEAAGSGRCGERHGEPLLWWSQVTVCAQTKYLQVNPIKRG